MKIEWAEKLASEINKNKWCYYEVLDGEYIRLYFREDACITEYTIKEVNKVAKKYGMEFIGISFCEIEQTPYISLGKR